MRHQTRRTRSGALALGVVFLLAGCHKAPQAFHYGAKAETAQNYDEALKGYNDALKQHPNDARYKLKDYQMRFEASQQHVKRGIAFLEQQQNQQALAEFQTALAIDPSSMVAKQEVEYTQRLIAATQPQVSPALPAKPSQAPAPAGPTAKPENPVAAPAAQEDGGLLEEPPALAPLSKEPVSLKMTADARMAFKTIGKLAGVNVIFDPDFQDKKISVDLINVTIQQALNVACVEGKAFWKPVSSNIILVLPDTPGKRKEQEEQVLKKIYLQHTQSAQEITDITTGLQQMLELRHVQALPRDNAILIRDTPAKILLASKLIQDSDRGKAEMVIQISVLQVRRDRARSLGIQPAGQTTLAFNPLIPLGPAGSVALDNLGKISAGDFNLAIPNAAVAALMSDSGTKIIQNPEVRVSDGESARLRVGDRIPIATGSFAVASGASPIVNTQFQYVDVGVNIDLVPHVHPDHSISMKLGVEVSSLNGQVNIGGVLQPIISQRRIDHEIRLQEGEVSILGGLAERSQTKSVTGWPGLSRLPLLRYLFSGEDLTNAENEVLIVVHPRLVRMRELTSESLRALSVGTDMEMQLRPKEAILAPLPAPAGPGKKAQNEEGRVVTVSASTDGQPESAQAMLKLDPESIKARPGEQVVEQVRLENVDDLFSASFILKYDPKVLAVEDVRNGDFLSGGTQEVAIIQRIDTDNGLATIFTTRQPNTAGVSGKGILLNLIVRHLTSAPATLQVTEAGLRNSRQRTIPVNVEHGSVSVE
ncbi:MAG TPA: cohesin domain-containing protein [Candidatus Angelobacter sp.]|nr:cohesin domain-containing protein [Candidatus Angelobacter sp.]